MAQLKRGISIDRNIWERAMAQAGKLGLSFVIAKLLEMWLNGDIKITIDIPGNRT